MSRVYYKSDNTPENVAKRIAKGEAAYRNQIWAYPKNFTPLRDTFSPRDFTVTAKDGKILTYKCHIVLEEKHFYEGPGKFPNDSTREIMAQFLHENKFPHKTAPLSGKDSGWHIFKPEKFGKQIGKCFTIYYPTIEHFYVIAKGVKELMVKYNLNGISQDYFEKYFLNMRYEYPVPDTNNILYYTMERVDGEYLGPGGHPNGYAQRKIEMNKYFGEGPLDFLFPVLLNPTGEAFW